jgi:hypothetical protein
MSSTVSSGNAAGKDISVGLSPQTAYGAPNASPVFRPVRRTTGKPKTVVNYTQDDTVNTDNQGLENVQESTEYTMELSSSFSKQSVYLMSAAIYGDFVNYTNTATTYAALVDGFTVPAAAYTALSVGDGFWVSGFAGATINGFYIVSAKAAANKIVTTIAPAATEAAGASVTLVSNKCKNGVAPTYFTAQEMFATSTTPIHSTYFDGLVNTFALEIGETGIITSTANFVFERKLSQTTAVAGQTYTAKLIDRSASSGRGLVNWFVDGAAYTCTQKTLTLNIDNASTGDDAAGCARQYVRGQFSVGGSASIRAKTVNPVEWRNYYENEIKKSMGVLISHPKSTDQTFIVMMQNAITEHDQANGGNDVANHEVSFASEGHAATTSTIMIFTNWAVAN